jgi:hypothetical protein
MEGAQNFTPPYKQHKVLTNPQITKFIHFQQLSLFKGLNSAKKQDLDKKWATFFHEVNIPSMLYNTLRS